MPNWVTVERTLSGLSYKSTFANSGQTPASISVGEFLESATPLVSAKPEMAGANPAPIIRVLVVDDHTVVRQAFALMLEAEGDIAVVGQAANGRIALDLIARLRPDVVLMDINMPVMDGIRATGLIRAEFPEVRVVGLSMYEEHERARAMQEAGAQGYVTKSASPDELLAVIRRVWRGNAMS